jgi:hypothetical protein
LVEIFNPDLGDLNHSLTAAGEASLESRRAVSPWPLGLTPEVCF